MLLQSIPPKIIQDIIIYSIPLFLITADRNLIGNENYWISLFGSIVASLPLPFFQSSKTKLVLASMLYIAYIFIPELYFFVFGFILNQSYNSGLLKSDQKSVCKLISKIELIGYLLSEIIYIPVHIKLFMGAVAFIISLFAPKPCAESSEPFESMKSRINSASRLNSEYRVFLDKEIKKPLISKPYLIDTLYIMSKNRLKFLFSMYFSLEGSEFFIFPIGILYILEIPWEYFCLLLRTEPNYNVNSRIIVNYLLFLPIHYLETYTFFREKHNLNKVN